MNYKIRVNILKDAETCNNDFYTLVRSRASFLDIFLLVGGLWQNYKVIKFRIDDDKIDIYNKNNPNALKSVKLNKALDVIIDESLFFLRDENFIQSPFLLAIDTSRAINKHRANFLAGIFKGLPYISSRGVKILLRENCDQIHFSDIPLLLCLVKIFDMAWNLFQADYSFAVKNYDKHYKDCPNFYEFMTKSDADFQYYNGLFKQAFLLQNNHMLYGKQGFLFRDIIYYDEAKAAKGAYEKLVDVIYSMFFFTEKSKTISGNMQSAAYKNQLKIDAKNIEHARVSDNVLLIKHLEKGELLPDDKIECSLKWDKIVDDVAIKDFDTGNYYFIQLDSSAEKKDEDTRGAAAQLMMQSFDNSFERLCLLKKKIYDLHFPKEFIHDRTGKRRTFYSKKRMVYFQNVFNDMESKFFYKLERIFMAILYEELGQSSSRLQKFIDKYFKGDNIENELIISCMINTSIIPNFKEKTDYTKDSTHELMEQRDKDVRYEAGGEFKIMKAKDDYPFWIVHNFQKKLRFFAYHEFYPLVILSNFYALSSDINNTYLSLPLNIKSYDNHIDDEIFCFLSKVDYQLQSQVSFDIATNYRNTVNVFDYSSQQNSKITACNYMVQQNKEAANELTADRKLLLKTKPKMSEHYNELIIETSLNMLDLKN